MRETKLFLAICIFILFTNIVYSMSKVELVSPEESAVLANPAVMFYYNVTSTLPITNCSLISNGNTIAVSVNIQLNQPQYFDKALADGAYNWSISCSGNETITSTARSLTIDTSPPVILLYAPASMLTLPNAELSVTTNENATCRYSTSSNTNFSEMSLFSITGLKTHTNLLSGLRDNIYNYYIKCNDSIGNIGSEYQLKFEVSLLPTAEIILSDTSPVKAGTVEVKVTTSKNMKSVPSLSYSFDIDTTIRYVSLSGSDTSWIGYMVIEDKNEKKVGTFQFSGTDIKSITGTVITDGKLFIVDTLEPSTPINIAASSEQNGSIKLRWYPSDDDIEHYDIYRAVSSGITYLDYYSTSIEPQFIDRSVIDKVTYYYKISIVDKAGNRGKLSDEVYATALYKYTNESVLKEIPAEKKDAEIPRFLPPNLLPKVDIELRGIDNLLIDTRDAMANLLNGTDEESRDIMNKLGITSSLENAEDNLNSIKSRIASLKSTYRSEEELDNELGKIELEIKKFRKTTPKLFTITGKTEFISDSTQEDINKAIDALSKKISLTEEEKYLYAKSNKKTYEKIKTDAKVIIVEISYLDGIRAEKTLVRKRLSNEKAQQFTDVIVIESIPKEVAENVNEIDFLDKNYEVLNDDPVVKFGFLEFGEGGAELEYLINKKLDLESAKKAKTVTLIGLNQPPERSAITGFSTFGIGRGGFWDIEKIGLVIGLLVIAGLSSYYFIFIKGGDEKISGDYKAKNKYQYSRQITGIKSSEQFPNLRHITPVKALEKESSEVTLEELYKYVHSIKIDVADRLYPAINSIYKILEAERISKESNFETNFNYDIVSINSLIAEIKYCIDNNETERIAILYPLLNRIYQGLSMDHKAVVYDKCLELHRKIITSINNPD